MPGESPMATLVTLRRLLLGILLFGLVGTATELVLMGHDEDAWQMIPLVTLAVAIRRQRRDAREACRARRYNCFEARCCC